MKKEINGFDEKYGFPIMVFISIVLIVVSFAFTMHEFRNVKEQINWVSNDIKHSVFLKENPIAIINETVNNTCEVSVKRCVSKNNTEQFCDRMSADVPCNLTTTYTPFELVELLVDKK